MNGWFRKTTVHENNQVAAKTWIYDNADNIHICKEYAYTIESFGTVVDTVADTYGHSAWGNLLTANGNSNAYTNSSRRRTMGIPSPMMPLATP
ncbi:MAG: hypothetical protein ACI3VZ_06875 [Faecousia sp.]